MLSDAADKIANELEQAFKRGARAVELPTLGESALSLLLPVGGFVTEYFKSEAQRALSTNLQVLGGRISTWKQVRRSWVLQGRNAEGALYTWSTWLADARVYSDELRILTRESVNASLFTIAGSTLTATASDVGAVAKKAVSFAQWPLSWKLGAAAAVVGVGLWLARPVIVPLLSRS